MEKVPAKERELPQFYLDVLKFGFIWPLIQAERVGGARFDSLDVFRSHSLLTDPILTMVSFKAISSG